MNQDYGLYNNTLPLYANHMLEAVEFQRGLYG